MKKRRRPGQKIVLAALFIAVVAFPLQGFPATGVGGGAGSGGGADFFVSINNPSASDSPAPYGTSPDLPWRTLHYAVSQLNDGDRLFVDPGNYSVAYGEADGPLIINHNNVEIWGTIGGGTIVDGTGAAYWSDGITVDSASGVKIALLQVGYFINSGISLYNTTGTVVENCEIYGNPSGYGIYAYNCDTTTEIRGNRIHDNQTGIGVHGEMYDSSPFIVNNVIYKTSMGTMDTGIMVDGYSTGGTAHPRIYHNTIDGGANTGIYITKDVDTVKPEIKYNIITGCNFGIDNSADIASTDLAYNDLFGNGGNYQGVTPGTGSISQDPLYSNVAYSDYSLAPASPCIDAIPPSSGDPVNMDIGGVARPAGSGFDMGATEFIPPGSNSPSDSPCIVTPQFGAVFAPGAQAILFKAQCYNDPEGDRHVATRWFFARADSWLNGEYNDVDELCMTNNPNAFVIDAHRPPELYELKMPMITFIPGMAYVWGVGYRDAGSGQTTWSEDGMFVVGSVVSNASCASIPPGTQQSDYRMVSFTHITPGLTAEEVFGDDLGGPYDTSLFRIGTYDPELGTGGYREYPDLEDVVPGRAYWVLARNGIDIDISGVPITTDTDVEVALKYSTATGNGWNMIGPPNNRNYLWSDVEVVAYGSDCSVVFGPVPMSTLITSNPNNPYIDTHLWEWTGSGYDSTASLLMSHKGYWVKARAPGVALIFPPSAGGGALVGALRRGVNILKRFGSELFSPDVAVADNGDEPPMPMAKLKLVSDDGKSSFVMGCFISSLGH